MDDVLCVVFYPDDSVRLEMTWFVQAVSVEMMNFVDWGRESDDSIRTVILITCGVLVWSRAAWSASVSLKVWFSALSQMDVTKQCSREYFSPIVHSVEYIDSFEGILFYGWYRLGRCRVIAVWSESAWGETILSPSLKKHGVDPEWST